MKSNLKKRVITFRVMLIMALTAVAALVLAACYDNPVALDQRVDITPQEGYSMFVVPGQSTRLQAAVFSGGTEITEPRPNVEWAFEGAVPTGFSINSDGVVSVAPNTALETVATVRATVRAAGRNEGRVRGDAAVGYFEVRASNFGNRAHYTVITATGSRWSTPGNYYQAWSGSVDLAELPVTVVFANTGHPTTAQHHRIQEIAYSFGYNHAIDNPWMTNWQNGWQNMVPHFIGLDARDLYANQATNFHIDGRDVHRLVGNIMEGTAFLNMQIAGITSEVTQTARNFASSVVYAARTYVLNTFTDEQVIANAVSFITELESSLGRAAFDITATGAAGNQAWREALENHITTANYQEYSNMLAAASAATSLDKALRDQIPAVASAQLTAIRNITNTHGPAEGAHDFNIFAQRRAQAAEEGQITTARNTLRASLETISATITRVQLAQQAPNFEDFTEASRDNLATALANAITIRNAAQLVYDNAEALLAQITAANATITPANSALNTAYMLLALPGGQVGLPRYWDGVGGSTIPDVDATVSDVTVRIYTMGSTITGIYITTDNWFSVSNAVTSGWYQFIDYIQTAVTDMFAHIQLQSITHWQELSLSTSTDPYHRQNLTLFGFTAFETPSSGITNTLNAVANALVNAINAFDIDLAFEDGPDPQNHTRTGTGGSTIPDVDATVSDVTVVIYTTGNVITNITIATDNWFSVSNAVTSGWYQFIDYIQTAVTDMFAHIQLQSITHWQELSLATSTDPYHRQNLTAFGFTAFETPSSGITNTLNAVANALVNAINATPVEVPAP